MRPQKIIEIKRDGGRLSAEHIETFINGVCDGSWADYQISALVMAMFIRGLDPGEQSDLTRSMLYSGDILDLSDIDRPKADKHSTGGVGDKTSLIIAPLAAACGLAVPMVSGRGLGHTGGTLDKLESIPGYNVNLSTTEFREVISKCGFAMSGQTADIAPADKKLYALRDATATVPYIPLIVGSIMSKKLAEDLDALVLDVKTGSGAFMKNVDDATKLAEALVATGESFGVKCQALVSNMGQPLGKFVGNSHEVFECVRILRNEVEKGAEATRELSIELTARMLFLAGIADSYDAARQCVTEKLESGEALEKFRLNVELQGGEPRICDDPSMLLQLDLVEHAVLSPEKGFVSQIDALAIGSAIVEIGGGRTRTEDLIDSGVGYSANAVTGDTVDKGTLLGILYCRSDIQAKRIGEKLAAAYTIASEEAQPLELIRAVIGAE